MILTLLFIALFIICLVGMCLCFYLEEKSKYDTEEGGYAFAAVGFFVLIGVLITSIWTITVNIPSNAKTEEYKLRETVKLYQNEKDILESFHTINDGTKTEFTSDITLEIISTSEYYNRVSAYNTKIFEFKTDTMAHKYRRKNPWLSWFESNAWDFVTEEYLDTLTYTVGK